MTGDVNLNQFYRRSSRRRILQSLSLPQLERLATEMREVLCNLVSCRSAHFASNLGVVELCLALASDVRLSSTTG